MKESTLGTCLAMLYTIPRKWFSLTGSSNTGPNNNSKILQIKIRCYG